MDLVSIIMPVYNSEKYIERAIKSVIKQTYKNWELIIVNDGSTDSSKQICEKYSRNDKRIKVINKNNEGVSIARNYGINNSQGKYIMFLDSDDFYEENMIEEMYKIMTINEVDIVKANYKIINKDKIINNKEYIIEKLYNKQDITKELIDLLLTEKIHCYLWLLMLKREIVVNFNSKLHIFEDANFYLETFIKAKSIYITKQCLYNYNKGNINSLTQKNIRKNIENMIIADKELKQTLKKYNYLTKKNIDKLDTRILVDIVNYCYLVQTREGLQIIKNILKELNNKEEIKKMTLNFNKSYVSKKEKIFTIAAIKERYIIFYIMCIVKNIKNKNKFSSWNCKCKTDSIKQTIQYNEENNHENIFKSISK